MFIIELIVYVCVVTLLAITVSPWWILWGVLFGVNVLVPLNLWLVHRHDPIRGDEDT